MDLSGAKKASRRALPAGMTVEAAVVLPVFLFAVANLLSLFLVFWSYSSKEAQLHQTARQIALYAYGQEDGEPDVRLMPADARSLRHLGLPLFGAAMS